MRRLGDKALKEIFQLMNKSRWGQHTSTKTGTNGTRLEDSKPYEYGDSLDLDIRQTLMNAVEDGRGSVPIKLDPRDFSGSPKRVCHKHRNGIANRC